MNGLLLLIPVALGLGLAGLAAFLWTIKSGQYDYLEGAAVRVLEEHAPEEENNHERKPVIGNE